MESKCSTEEKDQLFSKALREEKYEIAIILLQRDEEIISKLVDQQILECLLHQAAKLEESEHILAMVKTSVDINAIDKDGNTALHKAADNTFGENVKILLELGADKNIKNKIGQLPLSWCFIIINQKMIIYEKWRKAIPYFIYLSNMRG